MGTLDELRTLTDAAHARGMYVIIDIVVNHLANKLTFEGAESGASFTLHRDEYRLKSCDPAVVQPYEDYKYNNTFDEFGGYAPSGRYAFYDDNGNAANDNGSGTHTWSDFHHNGDLNCYEDPHCINLGKIYGSMDDLRTESPRVQARHIAAVKALVLVIASPLLMGQRGTRS